MPKSFQQKLKILYLMRVFSEKTDEAHPMSVKDLISYLESGNSCRAEDDI